LLTNPDALGMHRAGRIQTMFQDAEAEVKRLHMLRKAGEKGLWFRLKHGLMDRNQGMFDARAKMAKAGRLNDGNDIRSAFEEYDIMPIFVQGALREFEPTLAAIEKDGLRSTVSAILFLERIAAGDRWNMVNPLGYNPAEADRQLRYMEKNDPAGFAKAREHVAAFHEWVNENGTQAMAEDIFTADQVAETAASKGTYATFRVTKHIKDYVSAGIISQDGTLSDIGDPLNATLLKTVAMIQSAKRNAIKKEIAEKLLSQGDLLDVERAQVTQVPGEPPKVRVHQNPNLAPIMWRSAGKWQAAYVDKYIADRFESAKVHELNGVGQMLRQLTGNPAFRQLYITLNLGFQSRNFVRDMVATWKSHPSMTAGKVLAQYLDTANWRTAAKRVRGEYHPDLVAMEKAGALSVTLNELIRSDTTEDDEVKSILRRYGIGQHHYRPDWQNIPGVKQAMAVLDAIEFMGNVIETVPKIAGWENMQTTSLPERERAMRSRDYVGTPNPKRRGEWYGLTNNLFLFSNMGLQGMRRDAYLAVKDPTTRAGWWWKTIAIGVLPKVAMAAAVWGWFGRDKEEEMAGVSEYLKTQYAVVPLGKSENGSTIAMTIPVDEGTALISGLIWKAITRSGDPKKLAREVFNFTTSRTPFLGGPAPGVTIAANWMKYLSGGEPRDTFRDQPILTEDEMKAGGLDGLKPMIAWTVNQNGIVSMDLRDAARPDKPLWEKVVNATPAVNRFVRLTSAGEGERLREVAQDVASDEARERLRRREDVMTGLREGQTPMEFARGQQPRSRAEAMRLARGFDRAEARTDGDRVTGMIASLPSTEQKLAVLREKLSGFADENEARAYILDLRRKRLISDDVARQAMRDYRWRVMEPAGG
jgi:hypothetical protein